VWYAAIPSIDAWRAWPWYERAILPFNAQCHLLPTTHIRLHWSLPLKVMGTLGALPLRCASRLRMLMPSTTCTVGGHLPLRGLAYCLHRSRYFHYAVTT